jgi:hypothetical protein
MQLHKKLVLRIKIKETGFFAEAVGCYQKFSQKPGFWLVVNTQETGFFTEAVGCNEVSRKKPGFCLQNAKAQDGLP